MSRPEPRAPTPAESKVSPLIEFSDNGLYPYWDLKKTTFNNYLNVIRRAFASINPFSHQQIPTSERMGVGVRDGSQYYKEDTYPNAIHFDGWYPSHYNPFNNVKFQTQTYIKHGMQPGQRVSINARPIGPTFCIRTIKAYKTCLLANDDREDVCKQEQNNIIAICPSFALDSLKENKLAALKMEALDNQKYKKVMSVPNYNRGRTVADVPLRCWGDGSRENLRPNTLWADDRYADVTQEEVNAAKARVKKRREAEGVVPRGLPKYDRTYEVPPREVPLYSV